MDRMIKAVACVGVCLCVGTATTGCNLDNGWSQGDRPDTAQLVRETSDGGVDISLVDTQEVDLVEAVLAHRTAYENNLIALGNYYTTKGYASKAEWARFELKGLKRVQAFRYLMDSEIPSAQLSPTEHIPAADALYEQAIGKMTTGGHGMPALYREGEMIEAAKLLRQVIENHPTSDKIDDAAFFLGEIHKEYLKGQEQIAVNWYERAWTWDPETPYPARFQAAVVYDYRLHDRLRALELYQSVVERETDIQTNVRWASRRIHELTTDTRRQQEGGTR